MKALITWLLVTVTAVFGFIAWATGAGMGMTIAAAVLKLAGVSALSGMSYWLPVQLLGGCVVSGLLATLSAFSVAAVEAS